MQISSVVSLSLDKIQNSFTCNKCNNVSFTGDIDIFEPQVLVQYPELKKLDKLAKKYKKSKSINDKYTLLINEVEILLQEAKEPQKYLDRAIKINAILPLSKKAEERIPQIRAGALNGLADILYTFIVLNMPIKNADKYFLAAQKAILETKENSPCVEDVYREAMCIFEFCYDRVDSKKKEAALKLLDGIYKNSSSQSCKELASDCLNHINSQNPDFEEKAREGLFKEWEEQKSNPDKNKLILTNLGICRAPKLKEIVPKILNDKEAEHSLKLIATWCAGRVKTETNYQLLLKIINPPSDNSVDDLELKEMALHSFAIYAKKHSKEVKQILETIKKSDPDLKDIATILLDKLNGKYNSTDYFIDTKFKTKNQKDKYKKLRAQYIPKIGELNVKQKNLLDSAILPFYKIFKKLLDKGAKFHIINDTITVIDDELIGKRTGDGRFWDGVRYENSDSTSILNAKATFARSDNISAHEFNHAVLSSVLDDKDKHKLGLLFNRARKQNKCLDYYAAWNKDEYFAQGYEAYVSIYKQHKDIIFSKDFQSAYYHTRSVLKQKDPALYKFIEYCINKYD